jgi:hypothetical protein
VLLIAGVLNIVEGIAILVYRERTAARRCLGCARVNCDFAVTSAGDGMQAFSSDFSRP